MRGCCGVPIPQNDQPSVVADQKLAGDLRVLADCLHCAWVHFEVFGAAGMRVWDYKAVGNGVLRKMKLNVARRTIEMEKCSEQVSIYMIVRKP